MKKTSFLIIAFFSISNYLIYLGLIEADSNRIQHIQKPASAKQTKKVPGNVPKDTVDIHGMNPSQSMEYLRLKEADVNLTTTERRKVQYLIVLNNWNHSDYSQTIQEVDKYLKLYQGKRIYDLDVRVLKAASQIMLALKQNDIESLITARNNLRELATNKPLSQTASTTIELYLKICKSKLGVNSEIEEIYERSGKTRDAKD